MPKDWFHVQWGTYGSWLPGDPRGFRNHQHRVHSSGDYRNPPPEGEHAGLRDYSARVMTKEEVVLEASVRERVLAALVEKSRSSACEPLAIAVCRTHVHMLARFDRGELAAEVGKLKRASSHAVTEAIPGRVWAARCHPVMIRDRDHQISVFNYILDHAVKERASVWSFRETVSRG